MTERRRLVREEPMKTAPRRARDDGDIPEPTRGRHGRDDGDAREPARGRRAWTRGRPPLTGEMGDLGRGTFFAGVESTAIALDTLARVLRGAVDRAFDEDYERPGDLVRGVAGEADLAAYDLASELRNVPRRLSHRFDEAIRSPRADRGERDRREHDGSPADSPGVGRGARLRRDEDE